MCVYELELENVWCRALLGSIRRLKIIKGEREDLPTAAAWRSNRLQTAEATLGKDLEKRRLYYKYCIKWSRPFCRSLLHCACATHKPIACHYIIIINNNSRIFGCIQSAVHRTILVTNLDNLFIQSQKKGMAFILQTISFWGVRCARINTKKSSVGSPSFILHLVSQKKVVLFELFLKMQWSFLRLYFQFLQ